MSEPLIAAAVPVRFAALRFVRNAPESENTVSEPLNWRTDPVTEGWTKAHAGVALPTMTAPRATVPARVSECVVERRLCGLVTPPAPARSAPLKYRLFEVST